MKSRPIYLLRFIYINWILLRYRMDDLFTLLPFFSKLRFLIYLNPYFYCRKGPKRAERLRLACIRLGPIFVKLGQVLSTRGDLLPEDIINSLSQLQDKVPPFDGHRAKKIIEKAYKTPIEHIFDEFYLTPLASASIAQVHRGRLKNGKEVVVKVLRPHIERIIKRDIALLYLLARLITSGSKQARRLRLTDVIREFEKTLKQELDLQQEAANAARLRRHFTGSAHLYIPEVNWQYTTEQVMMSEYVKGIPVSQVETLKACGVDLKQLAENSVKIFFTQVIAHRFFHADMHPGNIFVCADDPKRAYYIAVDFGIMGTLTPTDQRYLAEILLAFFKQDYYRIATIHVESGWIRSDVRIDEFEAAIARVCEPIFEKPLKEISFASVLLGLFKTAKQFDMPLQPQLVLLQKTLFNVEGLGRQLYPDLNIWITAKPYLERWLRQQLSPKTLLCSLKQQLPRWIEALPNTNPFDVKAKVAIPTSTLPASPVPATKQKGKAFLYAGWGLLLIAGLMPLLHLDTEKMIFSVSSSVLQQSSFLAGVLLTGIGWLRSQ